MIKVFNGTDNTFSSNGDVVLNPTRAIVHKEDNGSFYLDLETNLNEETKIVPSEEGSTITINGSGQIQDVDTTKEIELTQVLGNTTQNGTPTPDTPIPISNVSGLQEVDVVGKNLFDGEIELGTISPSDGTLSNNNSRTRSKNFIKVQPNTTYTMKRAVGGSRWIVGYTKDKVGITDGNYNNYASALMSFGSIIYPQTFTTSATTEYIKWYDTNSTDLQEDVMLVKGSYTSSTIPPYEPYKGKSYEINLGKNLLNANIEQGSLSSSGTASSSTTRVRTDDFTSVISSTQYTISVSSTNRIQAIVYEYDDTSYLRQLSSSWSDTPYTFTTGDTTTRIKIVFRIYGNETIIPSDFTNPQLEKGSQATSYSPYFTPIELCKIGSSKDYIFKGKGVNLFDKDNTQWYRNNNGAFSNTTDTSTNRIRTSSFEIQGGKTYTLSGIPSGITFLVVRTYTEYGGTSTDLSVSNNKFTLNNNVKYIHLLFSGSNFTSATNTLMANADLMLNEGTSALPYEPYNAKDKWLLHKEIGRVVLNGSESYATGSLSGYYRFQTTLSTPNKELPNEAILLSNNFKGISFNNRNSQTNETCFMSNGNLSFNTNVANSESSFKTWLSTHNTIVYYVLATPTTTEITNSELLEDLDNIELLDGLNNIMITSSDLPATLDIHYNYVSGGEVKTSYIDYLVANNILVANTPQGNQAFRITNVDKTRSKIRLQANHIFYDSQNYIIKDSYVVEKNCNEALDHLNNATDSESPFTTLSDVNTIESYRCVRKSLYEAIQVILERWGGHLVRDNFEIKIMDTIGSDNQVVVRYGKNLKNIEAVYDWNAVATKLMPVGADGLLLPEEWLYANNSYEIPYTKVISFDQSNINQEDYADVEAYQQALIDDLRQKGNEYLETNSVPMVNYTLDANLEKISDVGDTIEVIDERLGINLLTHLISFDYNCLLDRYEQLQFGNFTPKLNDLMSTISESTTQAIEENNAVIKATLTDELTQATDRIWQALGSSYIIYDGDKILVLDQLPKESAQNVIMINSGGIGFSNTGIDGTFTSAWTIDNILNMENINVINLTADLIRGGILKLGSNLNQYGQLEIYNEANDLIAEMNKDGFKMYGQDGSYILINNQVGLSGYDRNGTRIYWADGDAFHMKKSEVEEEITLCGKMRYIPIQISSGGSITNDGIGLVSVYGGE